ncbi:D-alanyl-D-alanine endopeptidase [Aquabacterium sp.]|uniref:D-alanyl-D-alanine endopeptidase n=1 Tax=Aquabacterium sp. TaxID=1872578 RepID=UPI004037870D
MLSFTVATSVEAATKARQSSVRSAKAPVKAKKSVRQIKSVRQVKSRVRATPVVSRAKLSRAVDHGSGESARLTPVSINAAAAVRPASNLAAASSASGSSFGQLYGLHQTQDPLDLKSSVALVMDQDTNEVVFAKNSDAVLPIASLTKLMTAMVMVEAKLPLEDLITVTSEDVDTEKNSSSRLAVGATLTRGELLHLALMSSENRAAHALGRTFPGGLPAFVVSMNAKARSLGMADTKYVDPTGLNSGNQSSAKDLASLVKAAYQQPLIRELSTSHEHAVRVGSRQLQFHNTNSLVRNPAWDIGLQKTGYIVEAGRCLVMQAKMAGRKFIMVFLDSSGKYSRQADAERVRRWIESATQKGALSSLPHNKVTS